MLISCHISHFFHSRSTVGQQTTDSFYLKIAVFAAGILYIKAVVICLIYKYSMGICRTSFTDFILKNFQVKSNFFQLVFQLFIFQLNGLQLQTPKIQIHVSDNIFIEHVLSLPRTLQENWKKNVLDFNFAVNYKIQQC